jgi:hypothetical protein
MTTVDRCESPGGQMREGWRKDVTSTRASSHTYGSALCSAERSDVPETRDIPLDRAGTVTAAVP